MATGLCFDRLLAAAAFDRSGFAAFHLFCTAFGHLRGAPGLLTFRLLRVSILPSTCFLPSVRVLAQRLGSPVSRLGTAA